jgi:hypothetical protein
VYLGKGDAFLGVNQPLALPRISIGSNRGDDDLDAMSCQEARKPADPLDVGLSAGAVKTTHPEPRPHLVTVKDLDAMASLGEHRSGTSRDRRFPGARQTG